MEKKNLRKKKQKQKRSDSQKKMKRPRSTQPHKMEKKKKTVDNQLHVLAAPDFMSGMKKFKRKATAAAYARKKGLYIVGYDISEKFHKAFITCTREELFYMVVRKEMQYPQLSGLPGGWRNIYEGLLRDRPCIPYFDLDAEVVHNPGILKRIDDICSVFMEFVTEFLKKSIPNNPAVQSILCPDDWIVLDSSNRKKASRHLLLRKQGVEFKTLKDHSRFFNALAARMRHEALGKKSDLGRML